MLGVCIVPTELCNGGRKGVHGVRIVLTELWAGRECLECVPYRLNCATVGEKGVLLVCVEPTELCNGGRQWGASSVCRTD